MQTSIDLRRSMLVSNGYCATRMDNRRCDSGAVIEKNDGMQILLGTRDRETSTRNDR